MKTYSIELPGLLSKALIRFCIFISASGLIYAPSAAIAQPVQSLGKENPVFEVNIANKRLTQLLASSILAEYLLRVQEEGKMLNWPVVGRILKSVAIGPEKQKAIIVKGLEAWTRYLNKLSESDNLKALASYTDFRFFENSEFTAQEIEVLRNVLGFSNGAMDYKRGITTAFAEFTLTEAISDPELRAIEILNITQNTLLANGDFPLAAKSIVELFKKLPYTNVQNRIQQISFQLEHHQSAKRIQALLNPETLALGGFAFKGLTMYSTIARAGLVGSVAMLQNMSLLGKATAASVLFHGLGFTAYQISKLELNTSVTEYNWREVDFTYSLLNPDKVDYLARKALTNPKIYRMSKVANGILWGEAWTENPFLTLNEALKLSSQFNDALKSLRADELEIQSEIRNSTEGRLNPTHIATIAGKNQSRFPKYQSFQAWSFKTLNPSYSSEYKVGNCVAKALISLIYFDSLVENYGNDKFLLKLEVFSNHIRPVLVNKENAKFMDLTSNDIGASMDLGTLVNANEIFNSWQIFRVRQKYGKDNNPNRNPFVKYLPTDPRDFPSIDSSGGWTELSKVQDLALATTDFSSSKKFWELKDEARTILQKNSQLPFDVINKKPNAYVDINTKLFPFNSSINSTNIFVEPDYPLMKMTNLPEHLRFHSTKLITSSEWKKFAKDLKDSKIPNGKIEFLEAANRMIGSIHLICTFELPACKNLRALEGDLQNTRDKYLDNLAENLVQEISSLKDSDPTTLRRLRFNLRFVFQTLMLNSGPSMRRMHAVATSMALQQINFELAENLADENKKESLPKTKTTTDSNLRGNQNSIQFTIQLTPNSKLVTPTVSRSVDKTKIYNLRIDRKVLAILWTHIYNVLNLDIEEMTTSLLGDSKEGLGFEADLVGKKIDELIKFASAPNNANIDCNLGSSIDRAFCLTKKTDWTAPLLNYWSTKKPKASASIAVYGLPAADLQTLTLMAQPDLHLEDSFDESALNMVNVLKVIEFDQRRTSKVSDSQIRQAQLVFLKSLAL